MAKFVVNVYDGYEVDRQLSLDFSDTTQGASDSVRTILERFAREGVQSVNSDNRAAYAAQFSDDEPLDSKTVDTMLEMDDLSNMDEMEVQDYMNQNSQFMSADEFNNLATKNPDPAVHSRTDDPPGQSTQPTEN
jgi:hypothetical protein